MHEWSKVKELPYSVFESNFEWHYNPTAYDAFYHKSDTSNILVCVELLQRGNDCSLNKPEDEQSQPDTAELEQREQKQPREQQQQQFLVGTRRHVPQVVTHSHGCI